MTKVHTKKNQLSVLFDTRIRLFYSVTLLAEEKESIV